MVATYCSDGAIKHYFSFLAFLYSIAKFYLITINFLKYRISPHILISVTFKTSILNN